MTETIRTLLIIFIVALCTFFTRVFPFILFHKKQELPRYIKYLGDILPMAVIGILVVYCLKDIGFKTIASFLPAIISVGIVIIIHVWKRNNLFSIGAGTIIYMVLIQIAS